MPVMSIWGDLQVHGDLGLWIDSKIWAESSQAKLTAWEVGKGILSQCQQWKRLFDQLLWEWNQD
jgi:hypothetical protein